MKVRIDGGLPWVSARLRYGADDLLLERILVDTGSAATLIRVDHLLDLGMRFDPQDPVFRMRGVGGVELVVGKRVERLAVGELAVEDFPLQAGAMDYGFPIDGLLGTDFLLTVGAAVDFGRLELRAR